MKHLLLTFALLISTSWGSMDFASADSRALNTTASGFDNATFSILAWIYPTAYDFGTVFRLDENSNAVWLHMDASAADISLRYLRSGTRGQWMAGVSSSPSMPITLNAWTCIAITYDRSSTANDPVMYIRRLGTDADLIPVTPDEVSTPVGTENTPNTGYGIGADNTGFHENPFVGRIYGLQVWNTTRSEAEFETASLNPGSVTSGLILYVQDDGTDLSGGGRNATLTNVGTAANPPGIPAGSGTSSSGGGILLMGAGRGR